MTVPSEAKWLKAFSRHVLVAAISLASAAGAGAQNTNAEIFQQIAVKCLASGSDAVSEITLRSDRQHPLLNQAIINALQRGGAEVYLDTGLARDSVATRAPTAVLTYFVENASVRYEGRGRRRVVRYITLSLGYILQDPDGRVAADSTCSDTFRDEINRSAIDSVENVTMPITQGERPRRSWIRRYAEPVVVGVATAVAVYLFFNVRSDANDSP